MGEAILWCLIGLGLGAALGAGIMGWVCGLEIKDLRENVQRFHSSWLVNSGRCVRLERQLKQHNVPDPDSCEEMTKGIAAVMNKRSLFQHLTSGYTNSGMWKS